MTQEIQHKNYIFTYNYGDVGQPSKANVDSWWQALEEIATYGIGGWEVAPTTGQLHLQGYTQLEKKTRITALKKLLCGNTVNWRVAKGDEVENYDYCSKDGNFMEFGEATVVNPGKREKKRWKQALDLCKTGVYDEIDPQIQVQFMRNLDYIYDRYQSLPEDSDPGTKHLWIWGPTRSGKSRMARTVLREKGKGLPFYNKLQNKWWDHYKAGQLVLIDDLEISTGQALAAYFKLWLDIYTFKVEYKGGAKDIRPALIIITSNYHPWDIWGENVAGWYEPLMSRLEVKYLGLNPSESAPPKGPAVLVQPADIDQPRWDSGSANVAEASTVTLTASNTLSGDVHVISETTPSSTVETVASHLSQMRARQVIDLTDV